MRSSDPLSVARGFVKGNPIANEIDERGSASTDAIIRALVDRIEAEFTTGEGTRRTADGYATELALEEITFTARRR